MKKDWQKYLKYIVAWTGITSTVTSIWSNSSAAVEVPTVPSSNSDSYLEHINYAEPLPMTFTIPINDEVRLLIAGHRSHRSHSSHRSHYSSRGGGGYYYGGSSSTSYSAPSSSTTTSKPKSTTVKKAQPSTSKTTTQKATSAPSPAPKVEPEAVPALYSQCSSTSLQGQPTAEVIRIMRVQLELLRLGYYCGPIGGLLGPGTQEALKRFQQENGLTETGEIDENTLKRLKISY